MAALPFLLAPLTSGFGFLAPATSGNRSLYLALALPTASTTSSWTDARSRAQALGGDLAVIDSAAEQAFINDSLQALAALASTDIHYQPLRNYYIGLQDMDPGSQALWAWVSGTAVPTAISPSSGYSNWAQGQPDNGFGGQDKGVLWGVNTNGDGSQSPRSGGDLFQWDDVGDANISRGDVNYALAEIPVREYNGHLYHLVPSSLDASQQKANSLGGSLASIDNDAELQYLRTFLKPNEAAWISPSGSATSAVLRADGGRENLNSGQNPSGDIPSLALVEITPSSSSEPQASSIYVTDVIWPEAKSYGWNDDIPVEVKLSAPLNLLYKGKDLNEAMASSDKPYSLPILVSFGLQRSGDTHYYHRVTQPISLASNSTWPRSSLNLSLKARELASSNTTSATSGITLAIPSLRLDLNGINPDHDDNWDFTAFSLPGSTAVDLTLPASHQAGRGDFGVEAPPVLAPVKISTIQPPTPGTYLWGDSLSFQVTFDQTMYATSGSEPSALVLDIGGRNVDALEARSAATTGEGSRTLTYRYTLKDSDRTDNDGITLVGFKPGNLYAYVQGLYPSISTQLPGQVSSIPYSSIRTAVALPALQQELQLNGSAQLVNRSTTDSQAAKVLRLTGSTALQSGSAFLKNPVNLKEDASFSTAFQFRISDPGGITEGDGSGADGFVFTVQTNANTVGGSGGGIGYESLNKSVGVEFDTWNNGSSDRDNGNHVGIDLNGNLNSIAIQAIGKRFNDGDIWSAWVDYNGSTDRLEVRLSGSGDRPSEPLLATTVDLPSVLGSTNAFVGFTSGTGSAWGNHDILAWDFQTSYAPISLPPDSSLPSYVLLPAAKGIKEGNSLMIQVEANQAKPDSTIYWKASSDWPASRPSRLTTMEGTVQLTSSSSTNSAPVLTGTINLTTTANTIIEGAEVITVELFADALHQIPLQAQTRFTVADVVLQSLPLSRNSTPTYYLNLGDILGTIDRGQDLSKGELQMEGKPLRTALQTLAANKLGPWLSDPVAAIGNGQWSSQPVPIPSYANAETNPWPESTENASIIFVDGGSEGLRNLKADIGIDNMISIWINGEYRYGAYSPVHYDPNNLPLKDIDLGPLKPGLNAIQMLRSDEYGWAGADWTIHTDSITGAPLDIDDDGAVTDTDARILMRAMLGTYPTGSLSQGLVPDTVGAGRRAALHQRAYDAITGPGGTNGNPTEAAMDLDGNGLVRIDSDGLLLQRFRGGGLSRTMPPEQLQPLLGPNHRHGDPGVLLDRIQFGLQNFAV